jgi:hypothetical protein
MADSPSAFVLATAQALDGTEHVIVSQSGNQRSTPLSAFRTMVAAALVFPTADPHIAGAWWDSSGTLTKSSG